MIRRQTSRPAFTITELLVVIATVAVLLGLLFPALAAVRRSGLMTRSMSNMRQIASWMKLYGSDNRDFVVPSQFNYDPVDATDPDCLATSYKGKVRSVIMQQPQIGRKHRGTWTDILWTVFEIGVFPQAAGPRPAGIGHDYKYDSPDFVLYRYWSEGDIVNPLRSAAPNSRNTTPSGYDVFKPLGAGAAEQGLPGLFAANNFFNTDCQSETFNGWFTTNQIKMPEQSMYLVDSFAGEVIEAAPEPFQMTVVDDGGGFVPGPGGPGPGGGGGDEGEPPGEVDFRYSDQCLMLFLDGHIEPQGRWDSICDLEGSGGRGIRIRDLDTRTNPCKTTP
ncbi:MAG: type II secretion system protein [Planctomycetota bacterium]|jgi:type II secretory pathway pseudopilin PulG